MRNYVKQFRKSLLLDQRELAERSGLSVRTISNVETRKVEPTNKTKRKILEGLGITWERRHEVF